jgi:hypothetical protein
LGKPGTGIAAKISVRLRRESAGKAVLQGTLNARCLKAKIRLAEDERWPQTGCRGTPKVRRTVSHPTD